MQGDRKSKRGVSPKCSCGECKICKHRLVAYKYWDNNRKKVGKRNYFFTKLRRHPVSDEEMDRRAMEIRL